jgi:hypothetical protein
MDFQGSKWCPFDNNDRNVTKRGTRVETEGPLGGESDVMVILEHYFVGMGKMWKYTDNLNLTRKKKNTLVVFFLGMRLWLGGAASQRSTPLLCTVLSRGHGKQSYMDCPRVRNDSRGCRLSDDTTKAIKRSR